MSSRIHFWLATAVVAAILPSGVLAQAFQGPPVGPPPPPSPQRPPQMPNDPVIQQRVQPGLPVLQQLPAPFQLPPQQIAQLDWVLQEWEKANDTIKTFQCDFTRFHYDRVFGKDSVSQGEIKYASPDKGVFHVVGEVVGGAVVKGKGEEKWMCNGKSIFEYSYEKQQVVEYQLPVELQGRAIANGPLPFLFGSKASDLKQRYYLRIITPEGTEGQVWLQAMPRFKHDSTNFSTARVILTTATMQPFAIEILLPNGKDKTSFRFGDPKINGRNPWDPLGIFADDPFSAKIPTGWTKITEEAPSVQASRKPANGIVR